VETVSKLMYAVCMCGVECIESRQTIIRAEGKFWTNQ
jgi:hypothetical protein